MIRIVEVGPRDGLQSETVAVPTDVKVAYVDALSSAKLSEIEVSAFVSPRWVPQLADAEAVFQRIRREPGVVYSALVPNEQGLERAMAARVGKIAVFTAASETFNLKNVNASIAESIRRFAPVVRAARAARLPVRGYVSTAFWCPYEGRISPDRVLDVCRKLLELGVDELSIGDTIGKASPEEVRSLLAPMASVVPLNRVALHFHDTYHRAVLNAQEARKLGVLTFDSSAGGIGGCPYAPGATGNVATEALIEAFRASGAEVAGDLSALTAARRIISPALGRAAD
jgi:hydroxymethylglutaryl-CoA lyase